jgi:spore coat polysaccharide biosynthesis protein SpsF
MLAILQARYSSSRLKGKTTKLILGKEMLLHQIQRIKQSKEISKLIVATSNHKSDEVIKKLCTDNNIAVFCGDLENVLDRFYQCAKINNAKDIVRLTGDCPLIDSNIIDKTIKHYKNKKYDYSSNVLIPTFPDGLDVEVMSMNTLKIAWENAKKSYDLEHVTYYITQRKDKFNLGNYTNKDDLSYLRWSVDELEDFIFVSKVYENLYKKNPNFLMDDILKLLKNKPELLKINSHIERNLGLKKSLERS